MLLIALLSNHRLDGPAQLAVIALARGTHEVNQKVSAGHGDKDDGCDGAKRAAQSRAGTRLLVGDCGARPDRPPAGRRALGASRVRGQLGLLRYGPRRLAGWSDLPSEIPSHFSRLDSPLANEPGGRTHRRGSTEPEARRVPSRLAALAVPDHPPSPSVSFGWSGTEGTTGGMEGGWWGCGRDGLVGGLE